MTCWPLVTYLLAGSANLCIYILSPFELSSATMKIVFHSRKFTIFLLNFFTDDNLFDVLTYSNAGTSHIIQQHNVFRKY
jgi:hypothetical protein